ncbi:MAG: VOC family protein [Chloroflexi bacterium]|nr:VOC family protein [Chloroflexota bacterium]MCH8351915.1 VOC family protein [Chloroflexota bacterium]MCI0782495.1 VOC family protein [Chloroflexota bacterium]MCI0785885.1 VOC family protein [Chloroflexota bacterium]MCI0858325.1 VOC family protein [Chloroflexota bacterium]
MFTKVHHVTYVVESIQEMAEYLERNFGLKAAQTDDIGERGFKSILYHIGPTMVDFFEPTRDDTALARQLKEQGPGVAHVAWGIQGIDQAFQDLKGKGNQMRGDGPSVSPFGYKTLSIEPSSSHGVYFQLAEGEVA